jgi:uncharacterized integral membrane protein
LRINRFELRSTLGIKHFRLTDYHSYISRLLLLLACIFPRYLYTVNIITLISLVLFGIIVSYLAIQNTSLVVLNFAGYSFSNIPLYLVILLSLLVGFLVAGVLSSINSMFSAFKIMGKNNAISSSHKEVESQKEKIHELELTIAELKASKSPSS